MEPWQSWALVITVAGGAYLYYRPDQRRGRTARGSSVPEVPANGRLVKRREESRPKRKNAPGAFDLGSGDAVSSDAGSGVGRSRKRKGRGGAAEKGAVSTKAAMPDTQTNGKVGKADDGDEDMEWARQLAGLKQGTNLKPPEKSNSRTKTVKQSTASRSQEESAASSTTGADADDDLSSPGSPTFEASQVPSGHGGPDISDMLEKPAPGPAVLRVLPSTQPEKPERQQRSKPTEAESKKQLKNKRKAEERKQLLDQAEKERRVLLEKQLKTAREARGEPARNGVVPASAPSSNAWRATANGTQNSPTQNGIEPKSLTSGITKGQNGLLDTFEQSGGPSSEGAQLESHAANGWTSGLPSEEEQMRMISAMEDEASWNTVSKGKKGKKKPVDNETSDGTGTEQGDSLPPKQKTTETKQKSNADSNPYSGLMQNSNEQSNGQSSLGSKFQANDSDWAVL